MNGSPRTNQPFSVTSLLSPLDTLASSVDVAAAAAAAAAAAGRGSSGGSSSSTGSTSLAAASGIAASASVNDFAAAMQNPYGVSPMAHMAQFGTHSTYQYCNTDLSHYAAPASASWYGTSSTDPRFASKSSTSPSLARPSARLAGRAAEGARGRRVCPARRPGPPSARGPFS